MTCKTHEKDHDKDRVTSRRLLSCGTAPSNWLVSPVSCTFEHASKPEGWRLAGLWRAARGVHAFARGAGRWSTVLSGGPVSATDRHFSTKMSLSLHAKISLAGMFRIGHAPDSTLPFRLRPLQARNLSIRSRESLAGASLTEAGETRGSTVVFVQDNRRLSFHSHQPEVGRAKIRGRPPMSSGETETTQARLHAPACPATASVLPEASSRSRRLTLLAIGLKQASKRSPCEVCPARNTRQNPSPWAAAKIHPSS